MAASTLTGQWKGREWKGDATAHLILGGAAGDTVYVFGKQLLNDGSGFYEEWLSIRIPIRGVGTYVLDSTSVVVRVIVGGDVVGVSYYGIGASAGVLDVTGYGGPGGTIDGTLHFEAWEGPRIASVIYRFDNGRFSAPVHPPAQVQSLGTAPY